MSEGIRNPTTADPVISPLTRPTSVPATTEGRIGTPLVRQIAVTTPDRPRIDPTEMSIPAPTSTNVMPKAMIPMNAASRIMDTRLPVEKKTGWVMPTNSANAMRGTSTPSSRKFPIDARIVSRMEVLLSIWLSEPRLEPVGAIVSRRPALRGFMPHVGHHSISRMTNGPSRGIGDDEESCRHFREGRPGRHQRAYVAPVGGDRPSSYLKYFSTSASNCAVSRVSSAKLSTLSLLTIKKPVSVKAGIDSPLART